ncbi:hypothetical protein [Limnobaculum xujianqingii]|nr:hypothetical protein [Limnobaculum xujianqingii]
MKALRLLERSKPLKRIIYAVIALSAYYITPMMLTAVVELLKVLK